MSGRKEAITVAYTPLESGDAKSRWIRVEQERPEPETVSVAEAAEIIDRLYKIDPCEQGLGGGGEPADEEKEPAEEEVAKEMAGLLERADMCAPPEYWETTVRVLRSHKQPGYELRSETATVESITPVRGSHRQDVEVSGAVIELDMPYDGGLTGIPAGVNWTVRGSTVNLDRPLAGRVVLRYDAWFDRVVLRIPMDSGGAPDDPAIQAAMEYAPGDPFAVAGRDTASSGGGMNRREPPSASIVAFWGRLAASCELEPPDQDDAVTVEELAELCGEEDPGGGGGGGGGDDEPNDCWRTVHHYSRCNCSRRRVGEYETEQAAPCDGASSGSHVGSTEHFAGYVHCDGEEDDEIGDPEYYYRRCCKPPPGNSLPRCRRYYSVYNGGAEIDLGPEHYRNIYGEDVALVAVLPKNGRCGDKITTWLTPQRDCCDDVEDLRPREDNPEYIRAPGMVVMCVDGGKYPYSWTVSAGYQLDNESNYKREGGGCEKIFATEDACNDCTIRVSDGCSTTTLHLSRENPAEEMEMLPEETTISPGSGVNFVVTNAQGEVQWTPGELKMTTPQGLHHASFVSDDDFCGSTTVTAVDACGNMAHATVLSTRGRWVEQFDFDPCSAPWGGAAPSVNGYVDNYHGWRAQVIIESGTTTFRHPGGSCEAAWNSTTPSAGNVCGYTGTELVTRPDGTTAMAVNCDDPRSNVCIGRMCWTVRDKVAGANYMWQAYSHWIYRLFKWECD